MQVLNNQLTVNFGETTHAKRTFEKLSLYILQGDWEYVDITQWASVLFLSPCRVQLAVRPHTNFIQDQKLKYKYHSSEVIQILNQIDLIQANYFSSRVN